MWVGAFLGWWFEQIFWSFWDVNMIFIQYRFLSRFLVDTDSFFGLVVANTAGSDSYSGFFIGNVLHLKLLRSFCLALISNPTFF